MIYETFDTLCCFPNRMDPYQTAPIGVASSSPTLFASITATLTILIVNTHMRQTTQAHITLKFSYAGALRAKTKQQVISIASHVCCTIKLQRMALIHGNKRTISISLNTHSWASYKAPGTILSKRNTRRSGNKYHA